MRVLVVGAGVGGLTLAALLRRGAAGGVEVEIVERAPALRPDGFGLLLYPFGSRALRDLGCWEGLRAQGCALATMSLRDGRGAVVEDYDLGALTAQAGPLVCVRRPALMGLLQAAVGEVRWRLGTTVVAVDGAEVEFSDGARAGYDAIVIGDGMHSPTRRLVLGDPGRTHAPGHQMFVWWGPPGLCDTDRVVEWWAPGCMVATFPVPGAVQCAVLVRAGEGGDARGRVAAALEGVGGTTLDGVRTALAATGELYPWALADVHAARWTDGGRVALLGDAAVGALPTAGVGASAAMHGAAVLADELSRVDPAGVPAALERYAARVRRVAERHQRESRRFGRVMMIDSRLGAGVRDAVLRHVSASHLLSGVIASAVEAD